MGKCCLFIYFSSSSLFLLLLSRRCASAAGFGILVLSFLVIILSALRKCRLFSYSSPLGAAQVPCFWRLYIVVVVVVVVVVVAVDVIVPLMLAKFCSRFSLLSAEGMLESVEGRKLNDDECADLLKKKKVAAAITGSDDQASGEYSTWAFTAASAVVRFLGCDPDIVASIQFMELKYRSASYMNSLLRLQILATKTSTQQARKWVVMCLQDLVQHGLLDNESISKPKLQGDKHTCGLVHLLEFKMRCLAHILDVLMVQAQISDKSRAAIRSRCSTASEMRMYSQEDLSWQGQLEPSAQKALVFLKDVVYLVRFDNLLKAKIRSGSHPDMLLEIESVKEDWEAVRALRANELDEDKAAEKKLCNEDEDDEELNDGNLARAEADALALKRARVNPQHCKLYAPAYWRSVANQTVRSYVQIVSEPTTPAGIVRAVEQANVAATEFGKNSTLVICDSSLLGESHDPGQHPGLRKKFLPESWQHCLRKLLVCFQVCK